MTWSVLGACLAVFALPTTPIFLDDGDGDWDEEITDDWLVIIVEDEHQVPTDPTNPIDGDYPPDAPYYGCDPATDPRECAFQRWVDREPYDDTVPTDPVVITVRDVAQFQPSTSELIVEPNGWGIVNRPVNVFTDAEAHTSTGTVLGRPVAISWQLVSFTVDYGDGTVETHTAPGHAWADGEPWMPTETSHIYTETGDYVVSASVEYSAVVHVGGREVPVQGTVTVETGDAAVSIYWVMTRLVRGDCIDFPLDPGCDAP
ncbi:hypothetical protein [Agrococcus casei]|uniref:hypothetical protein n=1 Tax=Agrococcus casei TaxID=343512 RepID=UPI003F93A7C9